LKPAWTNSSQDPISKNPSQKRAGGVAQGVGPEIKAQYLKKKRNCHDDEIVYIFQFKKFVNVLKLLIRYRHIYGYSNFLIS
jgi:hypothetical protein